MNTDQPSVISHEEWSQENSLTSFEDRDLSNKWRPTQGAPQLTDTEVENAMSELKVDSYVKKFPRVERTFADPPIPNQTFGLLSFVPAKGAKPNENDVYGYIKLRGNFATEVEVDERIEYLIRNCDSYHKIYAGYVGRPLPLTLSSRYSESTKEIDIRNQMTDSISFDVKKKRAEEKAAIDDIKEREQRLMEESRRAQAGEEEVVDPLDEYITQKVKKAQLTWTYLEHIKKMEEVKKCILSSRETIQSLVDKHGSDLEDKYYKKYVDARKNAGIKDEEDTKDNFIKFMVEDVLVPGIDSVFTIEP